jgi:hypothetical protein
MKKDNGVQNERRNCGSIRIKEFGVHYEWNKMEFSMNEMNWILEQSGNPLPSEDWFFEKINRKYNLFKKIENIIW